MAAAGVIAEFDTPHLEAAEPPEARGLRRDEVRLLVSSVETDSLEHARFRDLPRFLVPGDLLVVNTSGTLNATLPAETAGGERFELHLSTRLPGGFWSAELRRPGPAASLPFDDARAGTRLRLPAGAEATLVAPYPLVKSLASRSRLWLAALDLPSPVLAYLDRHGSPIRYAYVRQSWPGATYQTVFAQEPGSAEMPSAGRPFTTELVATLVSRGVQIAPLVLHTGVASLEKGEPPYEEIYRVPKPTADLVTRARRDGRRVIAVGPTVVRALETVTDEHGVTSPGKGWTDIVISPERGVRSVDGLITGLHEPRATHLAVLQAVAAAAARRSGLSDTERAASHLQRAYAEAAAAGYLWHEFGDSHLILGSSDAGRRLPTPAGGLSS